MGELFSALNIWAALTGGIVYFLFGWLWYGPLFGDTWMKAKGMEEHPEPPKPVIFLYSLVLQAIAGISLALFMAGMGIDSALPGMYLGLAAGAGFVLTTMGVNGIFNDMSLKLFIIDGGYHLVGFAAAGFIIGVW